MRAIKSKGWSFLLIMSFGIGVVSGGYPEARGILTLLACSFKRSL